MGARPSQFKKGGGFLNGTDLTITGYEFTDAFNGVEFTGGRDPKTKKEKFHSLYCRVDVRVDGADEDVATTLFAGGADDFIVSDDGHVLEPVEDGRQLGANTGFAKFITSLCAAGFPDTRLSEDVIEFTPIIGTRCRTVQKTNVEDTKKLGQREGKNGAKYDRQDLVVDTVYELPGGGKETPGKAAKASPNGKAKSDPAAELKTLSQKALVEILTKAGKEIPKSKLSMLILTTPSMKGNAARDDVRKYIFDDKNLQEFAEDGVINFSKDEQTLSLAEA